MKVFDTSLVRSDNLNSIEGEWLYNGLDCCLTLEVLGVIKPQLDEVTRPTYERALALQAPILEMELRGVRIDQDHVRSVYSELATKQAFLIEALTEILIDGLGLTIEEIYLEKKVKGQIKRTYMWDSNKQLKEFLYGRLALPSVKKRNKTTGVFGPSVDRDALEKLAGYFHAEPILNHILLLRDLQKSMGVLRTGVDPDGRMRASYNIAGTDTGRLSSYGSPFGSGTNQQNITEELRQIFVADPGYKLAYIDLAQVQSRAVGAICWNLFHDATYLDACESGDLHTVVCQMTWKEFDWREGDYAHNRAIANRQFYRVDSYRQGSKKLGHATNFLGKAIEISRQTRIPKELIENFQRQYLGSAFPAIKEWHQWLPKKLMKDGFITTMTGRRRFFLGRRWENKTVKKAAAYEPQDTEAFINQTGMKQLWRASKTRDDLKHVQLLIPAHDAVLVQYPEEREDELIPKILPTLRVEIPLMHGRSLIVPNDVQVGWNWRHAHNDKKELVNPDGLIDYKGTDTRRRSAAVSLMDRLFL